MTWLRMLAIALAAGLAMASPAQGRIQPQMFCWDPDAEFPVGCDEDDEGEEEEEEVKQARRPSAADAARYLITSFPGCAASRPSAPSRSPSK